MRVNVDRAVKQCVESASNWPDVKETLLAVARRARYSIRFWASGKLTRDTSGGNLLLGAWYISNNEIKFKKWVE